MRNSMELEMELEEEDVNSVKNGQDFIVFLQKIEYDFIHNNEEWENIRLDAYFNAMWGWLESNYDPSQQLTWSYVAKLFYIATAYE